MNYGLDYDLQFHLWLMAFETLVRFGDASFSCYARLVQPLSGALGAPLGCGQQLPRSCSLQFSQVSSCQ